MITNQDIEQCEDRLLTAYKTSDLKTLNELIDDNLIFNTPDGQVENKTMDLSSFQPGIANIEQMESLERKIQVTGDTAIVSTIVYQKGSYMDGQFKVDGKARYLRVWKKIDGQLKVIGGSSIAIN